MFFFESFSLSDILQAQGIYPSWLSDVLIVGIRLLIMGIIAWVTYKISKKWLACVVAKIAGKTATNWDDLMFDQHFFNRFALFITPLVIQLVSYQMEWIHAGMIAKTLNIWVVLSVVLLVSTVLDGINRIYDSYPMARNRPIKVFAQVIKMFVCCTAVIIMVSIILEKSPEVLLVGLGAFAAVLMLIFKDAILGFVAGVQLIANKMVNIGDWIVMPACHVDGEVQEISLTTVKVQNWDKTISTIPTYKMVSESFTNWRGMQESQGRRIKRSVNIDVRSVHYLTGEELELLKKSDLLKDYIVAKLEEIDQYNRERNTLLDKRQLTNIGTFREYMDAWISKNPDIAQDMTHMVRQLQPGPAGIPLEIYCFSARQKWIEYERVQADLFDHLFAVITLFNLKVFQYHSAGIIAGEE